MCRFFLSDSDKLPNDLPNILRKHLNFRGPDYQSELISLGRWTLYHARLSIIDLNSTSNQPIVNKNKSALLFNGEIFNFQSLAKKYFSKEYKSDVLLLNDLIIRNKLILSELDGFFSFCFIDSNGNLKFCARDRLGVKPLYYFNDSENTTTLCSEPAVIGKIFSLPLNNKALTEYRMFRYPLFTGAYHSGIHSVRPGSKNLKELFFDLEREFDNQEYKPANITDIELSITRSVKQRMMSDVPVGLLLSTGVDSNLIRLLGGPNNFFTGGLKTDYEYKTLKNQSIRNHKYNFAPLSPSQFIENHKRLVKLRCEPLSVPNEVYLNHIASFARESGFKVLLSGEGADEFFAGYDRIFRAALSPQFSLNQLFNLYRYECSDTNEELKEEFLQLFKIVSTLPLFEKVRWFFLKYHLPILFRRLDFSLMVAGVEGREPLAAYHILKKALTIAPYELVNDRLGKLPLRAILAQFESCTLSAYSSKLGFPVDIEKIYGIKEQSSYSTWFDKNLEYLL